MTDERLVIGVGDKIEGHTITEIRHDPFSGGFVLVTDEMKHYTPDGGDFGADWFEQTCYHISKQR